jgi:hypothetical protein
MKMANVKVTPKKGEKNGAIECCTTTDYIWPLTISLDADQLKKLDIDYEDLPAKTKVRMEIEAVVISRSKNQNERVDGKAEENTRAEFEIHKIGIEPMDGEDKFKSFKDQKEKGPGE